MKRLIYKTFKYRLKPLKSQRDQFAGARRFMYNKGLELIKKSLESGLKIPTYTDLAKTLPFLKAQEDTKWLSLIHSQVLQQSLKDLAESIKAFFRETKKKEAYCGLSHLQKKRAERIISFSTKCSL